MVFTIFNPLWTKDEPVELVILKLNWTALKLVEAVLVLVVCKVGVPPVERAVPPKWTKLFGTLIAPAVKVKLAIEPPALIWTKPPGNICQLVVTFGSPINTLPSSLTNNEADVLLFSTLNPLVADVAPEPLTYNLAVGSVSTFGAPINVFTVATILVFLNLIILTLAFTIVVGPPTST